MGMKVKTPRSFNLLGHSSWFLVHLMPFQCCFIAFLFVFPRFGFSLRFLCDLFACSFRSLFIFRFLLCFALRLHFLYFLHFSLVDQKRWVSTEPDQRVQLRIIIPAWHGVTLYPELHPSASFMRCSLAPYGGPGS